MNAGPRSSGTGMIIVFALMVVCILGAMFVGYDSGVRDGKKATPCPAVSPR